MPLRDLSNSTPAAPTGNINITWQSTQDGITSGYVPVVAGAKGEKGDPGPKGDPGAQGVPGAPGPAVTFGTSSTRPASAVLGTFYYQTDLQLLSLWNGSLWIDLVSVWA